MNITKEMIALNQNFEEQDDAIRHAGDLLVEQNLVDKGYIDKMIDRDKDLSTYMGNFIAIPHGSEGASHLIHNSGISIVQVPEGVRFGENLVTVVFGIAGKDGEHLDLLSQIAVLCEDIGNVQKIADAQTEEEILTLIEGA